MGEIIEGDTCFYFTKAMNDDPQAEGERAYHSWTRGFLMNEIFRRVEP